MPFFHLKPNSAISCFLESDQSWYLVGPFSFLFLILTPPLYDKCLKFLDLTSGDRICREGGQSFSGLPYVMPARGGWVGIWGVSVGSGLSQRKTRRIVWSLPRWRILRNTSIINKTNLKESKSALIMQYGTCFTYPTWTLFRKLFIILARPF